MKENGDRRELKWIGLGLRTIPETHRMTHVPAPTIRRWIKGYRYRRADGFAEAPSVWRGDLLHDAHNPALTFLDLLDIRVVDLFRRHGVRWTTVREAARIACDMFGSNHPFSRKRFRTDGKRTFVHLERSGHRRLLDASGGQFVFEAVISRTLYEGIEFDRDNEEAQRWYRCGPARRLSWIRIALSVALLRPAAAFRQTSLRWLQTWKALKPLPPELTRSRSAKSAQPWSGTRDSQLEVLAGQQSAAGARRGHECAFASRRRRGNPPSTTIFAQRARPRVDRATRHRGALGRRLPRSFHQA